MVRKQLRLHGAGAHRGFLSVHKTAPCTDKRINLVQSRGECMQGCGACGRCAHVGLRRAGGHAARVKQQAEDGLGKRQPGARQGRVAATAPDPAFDRAFDPAARAAASATIGDRHHAGKAGPCGPCRNRSIDDQAEKPD